MAASLSTVASTSTAGSPNYDVLGTFASYLYGRIRSSLDQKELQEAKILTFSNRRQQNGKLQAVRIVGLGGVGKAISAKDLFEPKSSHQRRSCFLSDIRGTFAVAGLESCCPLWKHLERISIINGITSKAEECSLRNHLKTTV